MSDIFDHDLDAVDRFLGGEGDHEDPSEGYDREDFEHEVVSVKSEHVDAQLALEKEAEEMGYKHGWVWHRLNEKFGREIANALYNGYAELNTDDDIPT
jgi:hypothetical protein